MSLPSLSVSRPVAVTMLMLGVVFLGAISFGRLPIDLLPDVQYPRLVIHTQYPDVGPAEVERFVTEPIERAVGRVPGVERVESTSREGVSLVTLRFAWGSDMDFAVLNVREQLDNIRDQLPELASRPAVLRTDPDAEPIITLSVTGRSDVASLKQLVESVFKRRLEQIDGIAEAALAGGLEREIQVDADPRLLESYGFTIADLTQALEAANQSAPGGTILRGRYRYALRTLGEFQSVDEIRGVPLRGGSSGSSGSGGRSGSDGAAPGDSTAAGAVTIGDVAIVTDGFRERESVARYNGREAVGLLLYKESGANTVRATERVDQVLDQLRAQYPDVTIDMATSQAAFIADAIANVIQALVLGGVLAFLVLFLFLRNPRYPVAVALAIPVSVVATFALLDLAGVSLNIMSLGGLALGVGMLVDNSIVVLENIFRHREAGVDARQSAVRGAREVQGAITASTLTTIAVFGPVIYVEGVAGELFEDLSLAVAFALLASLVVALTLLPMLAARMPSPVSPLPGRTPSPLSPLPERERGTLEPGVEARVPPLPERERGTGGEGADDGRTAGGEGRGGERGTGVEGGFERFANWYHALLARALDVRGRVVGYAAAALIAALVLGGFLERDVLPDVDQGAFTVRMELARGMPLERTAQAAERLEALVLADSGVAAVFTRVGRQEAVAGVEDEESGLHTAVLDVRLEPGERTRRVVERLRARLTGFSAEALAIETGTATALGRLLGGAEADLAIRVRGDDLEGAWSYARLVERRLRGVGALTNVRLGTEEGQPEIRVEINRERAAAYGIEPRLIAETVERYMQGAVATEYVDFDEKVPVVVRLPEAERRSLETLRVLRVSNVPLRELVTLHEETGPAEIRRLEQSRTVTVFADVARGGLDGAVASVRDVLRDAPPPRGLRLEVGGANEERDRGFRDLAFAFALALLLVYMILAAQFESLVHPFTILLSVPLAVVGAVAALFLTGEGINTMSLIGVVILVGIVVNDAIVKVDFINQMRAQGMAVREAILEAGRVRLRPILMTTVTTVLGLTPMALGLGSGADLRAPLAIAVIGGLISATALTLIVVPVTYDLIDELRRRLGGAAG